MTSSSGKTLPEACPYRHHCALLAEAGLLLMVLHLLRCSISTNLQLTTSAIPDESIILNALQPVFNQSWTVREGSDSSRSQGLRSNVDLSSESPQCCGGERFQGASTSFQPCFPPFVTCRAGSAEPILSVIWMVGLGEVPFCPSSIEKNYAEFFIGMGSTSRS